MVEWLAGNRIRGTTAERPALGLQSPSVGGWVELGRTTLGSAGADITVSSLADKRYYMVLTNVLNSGVVDGGWRFNGDTGSNYSARRNYNGGSDTTVTSSSWAQEGVGAASNNLWVSYIANKSDKEKLAISHQVIQSTAGASTAPLRNEHVAKWSNTSDAINSITQHEGSAGSFNTGSEVVVLGWDPADTHTTNFWEELASVDADGTGTGLDSGVFTAKKYLWIQSYTEYGSGAHISPQLQVGNGTIDTGANYTVRHNSNGTEYSWTGTSAMGYGYAGGADNKPVFTNTFIINNAGQDKLSINHAIEAETAGAGTAPTKIEDVGKWANTSAQINRVQWGNNTGNISSKSTMRVWGSD